MKLFIKYITYSKENKNYSNFVSENKRLRIPHIATIILTLFIYF